MIYGAKYQRDLDIVVVETPRGGFISAKAHGEDE